MTISKPARLIIATIGCLLSLTGCDEDILFHSYKHIPNRSWRQTDTVFFETDTLRKDAACHFEVGLRITELYPYNLIWLGVTRQFHHPDTVLRDTIACQLTDTLMRRTGRGVHLYQYEAALPPLRLHAGQSGRIGITHLMQRETVTGVHDIGLRISSEE